MNKRNYMPQLAAAEVCERFMQWVSQRIRDHVRLAQVGGHRTWHQKWAWTDSEEAEGVDSLNTTMCYDITEMTKESENILEWIHTNDTDVATKVRHN